MGKNLKQKLISSLKICFQVTLVLTSVFVLIFRDFNLKAIYMTFLVSGLYSFVLGYGQGFINAYLSSKFDWIRQTNKRVWFGIICTVLYTVPAVLLVNYVLFVKIQGVEEDLFFKKQYFWIHLFYILISFLISSFLHARSFMQEWKKATQQEAKEQKIIAKNETAKFETLKNQLDPHFLFNSLNVLTALIEENPKQAEKFTTKLSKVYRYVLEQRNKELVSVSEELRFAKNYMELLQMRFEDALHFELQTDINPDLNIVPLSLQLLLENAVKHNVVSVSKPLTIKIYQYNDVLVVENNSNPKQVLQEKSTKVGLQNIMDRYGLVSSNKVKIINNNDVFSVGLPLLQQKENSMEVLKSSISVEEKAKVYVAELKAFYSHLFSYLLFCVFIVFVNLKFSPHFHWFWFPIVGWGIGIISHALTTFDIPLFGRKWEEKRMQQYIERNK